MDGEAYFPENFRQASRRFRSAARAAGARLKRLETGGRGPGGEKLAIDIAVLGNRDAKRVLLHSSGVHGVEGFAGSAIQLRLLEQMPDPGKDGAIVLVHCVNPYGMAHLRRVNEHNVDLNRNFLKRGQHVEAGAHAGYHILHKLLNPESRGRLDLLTLPLLWRILRHGWETIKQAGGQGQYLYPQALFFGGEDLETGPRLLLQWMKKQFQGAERVLGIDVHTGVGEGGEDWLIVDRNQGGAYHQLLLDRYGAARVDDAASELRKTYLNLGGLDAGIVRATRKWKRCVVDFVTQEFGAAGGRQLLRALRDENRATQYDQADVEHSARIQLRNSFTPLDVGWRRKVLKNGLQLAEQSAAHLFGR